VENKLGLEYEDLGKHEVKNISRPIQVYRVLSYPGAAAHRVVQAKESLGRKWRKIGLLAAAVVVIVGVLGIWQFYIRHPSEEPASVEKMAHPLPDKPSIAVLAFDNMSGDPSQEYFSDGIAENIISALSKVDELFVIARNSSFFFKGKPVKIQQVSEELGVRYVLEGSVQKSGDRVRITAQLIDAINGQHLWAEKYDRDLQDIFEIQDEITKKIVTSMRLNLTEGEQARLFEKQTKNLDVYLKLAQVLSLARDGTKESIMRYGQVAKEIIDMEPDNPVGYRHMGWYHRWLVAYGVSPQENMGKAFEFSKKALAMDESDGWSHSLLGYVYLQMRKHEKAIESGKRSIELLPNGAMVHMLYGNTLNSAGRVDEAIAYLKKAIRLNPFPAYWYICDRIRKPFLLKC
jgi:TolB-like protein